MMTKKFAILMIACLLMVLAYPTAAAWVAAGKNSRAERRSGVKTAMGARRKPSKRAVKAGQKEGGGGKARPAAKDSRVEALRLVNKSNPLPAGYVPPDLRPAEIDFAADAGSPKRQLRAEAAEAMERLYAEAAKDGIELMGVSGYRSYERQVEIFTAKAASVGEEAANQISAKPGQSEHQSGLAIDISCRELGGELAESFAATAAGKWVAGHAEDFGFIIRYPQGKEAVTGYQYEPWHLRYVGVAPARQIAGSSLTLEEYLANREQNDKK